MAFVTGRVITALFELAYQRSSLDNAIEENRTAIFAINDYVNKQGASNLLFTPTSKPATEQQYSAFLYKRIDLAQHFIGSAALTASINKQVAQVVGEEKELSDAQQGGSGFSFIDLAADKAGMRFGEMATSSPENARNMQKAMSRIKITAILCRTPEIFLNIWMKLTLKTAMSLSTVPLIRKYQNRLMPA